MALAKLKVSEEDLATEKGPVMERHVEERFERIERGLEETKEILKESAKRHAEFQESFDRNLEGMRQILQETITLSRENRMRIHNDEGMR